MQLGSIPATDAADRTDQRKGANTRVARHDPSFGHALGNQAAKAGVHLPLERAQFVASGFGQRVFANAADTQAEITGHYGCIQFHRAAQAAAPGLPLFVECLQPGAKRCQSAFNALKEDLFLVGDVVVQGRLADPEALRYVIERSALKALEREQAGGREQHRLRLGAVHFFARATGPPGGVHQAGNFPAFGSWFAR